MQWPTNYKLIKSPAPAKTVALDTAEGLTAHPWSIQKAIFQYRWPIENWTSEDLQKALEKLEDVYSMCLPSVPYESTMLPHTRRCRKACKKAVPASDGWTKSELAALPPVAWCIRIGPTHCSPPCTRGFQNLRERGAFKGRIVSAQSMSSVQCLALMQLQQGFWGVSVDFSKMFNMLSGRVAAQVSLYRGLAPANPLSLLLPIQCATAFWRLPFNALALECFNSRGLPQGMASSVLLSELAISVLVLAYVDDLNFASESEADMVRTIQLLREFEADFRLSLSEAKTHVWASTKTQRQILERDTGFQGTDALEALGAQWAIMPTAKPTYPKEHARLGECIRRQQ